MSQRKKDEEKNKAIADKAKIYDEMILK